MHTKTTLGLLGLFSFVLISACSSTGTGGGGIDRESRISADRSTIFVEPTNDVPADGVSMARISVRVLDEDGHGIPNLNVHLSVSGSGNALTQPTGPTDLDGLAQGTLTSTIPETKEITAKVVLSTREIPLSDSYTLDFVHSFEGNLSTITAFPQRGLLPNGVDSSTITVILKGAGGSPMVGTEVFFSASGEGNILTSSAITDSSGAAHSQLRSSVAGEKVVTITIQLNGQLIEHPIQPAIRFGLFQEPITMTENSASSNAIQFGDFNEDGHPDLISISGSFPDFYLYLNDGEGNFDDEEKIQVVVESGEMTAFDTGDLNQDGHLDVVLLNSHLDSGYFLLGNGDGTFGETQLLPISVGEFEYFRSVTIGSYMEEDVAKKFIAVLTEVSGESADKVRVLRIDPENGNFEEVDEYSFNYGQNLGSPRHILAEDMDQDGQEDLLVANSTSLVDPGEILFFKHNPNAAGKFWTPMSLETGHTPRWIAVGDLNGDGFKDIVAANANSSQSGPGGQLWDVSVILGDGLWWSDLYYPSKKFLVDGVLPRTVDILDVNSDGKQDVVASSVRASSSDDARGLITILFGDDQWLDEDEINRTSIIPPVSENYYPDAGVVIGGDVNGDQIPDLALSYPYKANFAILRGW